MVSIFLAMLIAAEPVDCGPKGSMQNQESWFPGRVCKEDIAEQEKLAADKAAFRAMAEKFRARPFPLKHQAEVKAMMNARLPDGPSTRYEWGEWTHPLIYCFRANTKNRFGGYIGWQTFAVQTSASGEVIGMDDPFRCLDL